MGRCSHMADLERGNAAPAQAGRHSPGQSAAHRPYDAQQDRDARTKARGSPEQGDVSDYEFTVVLDLLHDSNVVVTTKDRTKLFDQPEVVSPGSAGAF